MTSPNQPDGAPSWSSQGAPEDHDHNHRIPPIATADRVDRKLQHPQHHHHHQQQQQQHSLPLPLATEEHSQTLSMSPATTGWHTATHLVSPANLPSIPPDTPAFNNAPSGSATWHNFLPDPSLLTPQGPTHAWPTYSHRNLPSGSHDYNSPALSTKSMMLAGTPAGVFQPDGPSGSMPHWPQHGYQDQFPGAASSHHPFSRQSNQHTDQTSFASSPPTQAADDSSSANAQKSPKSLAPTKQNRHLACAFCRTRKLRCILDDDEPSCRQCLRRNLPCSMPDSTQSQGSDQPKAKKRKSSNSDTKRLPDGSETSGKRKKDDQTKISATSDLDPHTEANHSGGVMVSSVLQPLHTAPWSSGQFHMGGQDARSHGVEGVAASGSIPIQMASSLIPMGSDAAVPGIINRLPIGQFPQEDANNEDEAEGKIILSPSTQPLQWSTDWWNRCLAMFGHRSQSIHIVENLLARFVAKHNTMMALIHGPTLMHSLRSRPLRQSLHPALVYAVLTTSVCDLQSSRLEPYLADITAADSVTQRLSRQLRQTAMEYIEASLMHPDGLDVPLGQAVSVLVLTCSSAMERNRLFSILEAVVNKTQLVQTASKGSTLETLPEPGDEEYFATPKILSSSAAEIKCEAVTRLCKTQAAHAARVVIAKPDEDFSQFPLSTYLLNTRAHDYWDPSNLQQPIPKTYWASRHFSRAASLMSKVFMKIANLPASVSSQSASQNGQRSDVKSILQGLATVEGAFRWLKDIGQEEASSIYPQEAQMFLVKLHVSSRFSLWRKTGLWIGSERGGKEDDGLLPSFDWWLIAFSSCINKLEGDARRSLSLAVPLEASDAEVESALRHVRLGVQMLTVLEYTHYGIGKLLSKALATLQMQVNLRPVGLCTTFQPLSLFMDQVRGELEAQQESTRIFPVSGGGGGAGGSASGLSSDVFGDLSSVLGDGSSAV